MNRKYNRAELLEKWESIHQATRELLRLWQSVAADGEARDIAKRAIQRLAAQQPCTQKLANLALHRAAQNASDDVEDEYQPRTASRPPLGL